MLELIAALTQSGVIGINGTISWNIPEDLAHFRQYTMNQIIVMGRKTFQSLPRPLPNRTHIVLTNTLWVQSPDNCKYNSCPVHYCTMDDLEKTILEVDPDRRKRVIIIGGGEIYRHFYKKCDRMCLTVVDNPIRGDVAVPEILHYARKHMKVVNRTGKLYSAMGGEVYEIITYKREL